MGRLIKKKYYDEAMEQNEKLLELCRKQDDLIKNLKLQVENAIKIMNTQQSLLEEYRKENLELKKAPLKSVQDLINHI